MRFFSCFDEHDLDVAEFLNRLLCTPVWRGTHGVGVAPHRRCGHGQHQQRGETPPPRPRASASRASSVQYSADHGVQQPAVLLRRLGGR